MKGALLGVKDLAEIAALKNIEADMKQRIFDNSTGTSGEVFGSYRSEAYKKRRKDAGRQTDIKDLQFSGHLKTDMQVGVSSGKNVIGFLDDKSKDIVKGQEDGSKTRYGTFVPQIGFPIFKPQDEEISEGIKKYNEVINDKIKEVFNV